MEGSGSLGSDFSENRVAYEVSFLYGYTGSTVSAALDLDQTLLYAFVILCSVPLGRPGATSGTPPEQP